MPPVPRSSLGFPADCHNSSGMLGSVISLTSVAFGLMLGSEVYNPGWSVSINSRSASIRLDTKADRLSLSPTLISSVATASFSLIIGITFCLSKARIVFLEFR